MLQENSRTDVIFPKSSGCRFLRLDFEPRFFIASSKGWSLCFDYLKSMYPVVLQCIAPFWKHCLVCCPWIAPAYGNEPLLFKFCLETLGFSAKFVCISTHFMLCLHLATAALVQSCWQQFISRWLFPVLFKRKVAFTSETRNVSMIYRSKLKTNSFIAKNGTNPYKSWV